MPHYFMDSLLPGYLIIGNMRERITRTEPSVHARAERSQLFVGTLYGANIAAYNSALILLCLEVLVVLWEQMELFQWEHQAPESKKT